MSTLDVERMLIAKAVHGDSIAELLSKGVRTEHFADPDCRAAWEFLSEHLRVHSQPATLRVAREAFPHASFEVVTEPLSYVHEKFVEAAKRRMAIEALRDLAEATEDEKQVGKIDELFLDRARKLAQMVPAPEAGRFASMRERIKAYRERVAKGQVQGIPLGIPDFDSYTLGLQPHEVLSITGWQGTGKSTLMAYVVWNAYLNGKTPLIFSLEMEQEALFRKFDTMSTNFPYMALKSGRLDKPSLKRWEEMAARAEKAKNDILIVDDVGKCSVEKVFGDTQKYKPDLVAIDYISLMEAREGQSLWERITYLTRELKQQARTLKIPLIMVAQTNIASADAGAELSNISFSRSIGADSDIVLGLHSNPEMRQSKCMELRMLKNRDGPIRTTRMKWDLDVMRFEPWTAADTFAAKP